MGRKYYLDPQSGEKIYIRDKIPSLKNYRKSNDQDIIDNQIKESIIDYTVTITESTPEGFAKIYNIKQTSTGLNATINIPKDMVVSSGKVETYTLSGEWGLAGTYLVLTLANATSDKVYINVGNLIEYVTSGSTADDQIQIEIDNEHKVTAILKNSSVTKEQLDTNLQNELNSKVNAEYVEKNGGKINTISVNGVKQEIIDKSVNLEVVIKPTITSFILIASNWDANSKSYSFETTYPSTLYNINLSLSGSCTDEEELAFLTARIRGSASGNIAIAKGTVPTVDIPVILEVVKK